MVGQEDYMNRILYFRSELCQLANRMIECHEEDRDFYEEIAKQYVYRLKLIQFQCSQKHDSLHCYLTENP